MSAGTFPISFVQSKYDNQPQRAAVSWQELCSLLSEPRRTACTTATCGSGIHAELDKNGNITGCRHKNGRGWIPATSRAIRKKTEIELVSVLVVDADHLPDDDALGLLLAKLDRYSYVAHATHSDKPSDRCARIAVPLSQPVPGGDWPRFWPAAMAMLGMPADPSCCDASRLYFLPSRPSDADQWCVTHEGEPLDVLEVIKTAPQQAPSIASSLTIDESGKVGAGQRHAMLKSIAGAMRHRGSTLPVIEASLLLANQHQCDPPKPEDEVKAIAAWAAEQPVSSLPAERPRTSKRTPPSEPAAETSDPMGAEDEPLDDDAPPHGDEDAPSGRGGKTRSVATALVALSLQDSELWHSTGGEPFVTVKVGTHREHLRIGSSDHRRWMARLAWRAMDRAVGDSPIKAACAALAGIAVHDCEARPVHIRIAGDGVGKVWIDLVDDEWRAVEIDANGWRVVSDPPVRFARRNAMSALPVPVAGGQLDELREHVRVSEDSWALVAGWLVGALSPAGPYPALVYRGQHGAGKSWSARILRSLVDPSRAPIRSEPREPRDLVISASNSHVIALDNLSSLPPWLSDGLCRLATGGGYAARSLYTDSDEVVIDVQRPTILTGITDVVTAPDLLDRALLVELDAIMPVDRKTERNLAARWSVAQPRILGALYNAVSCALRRRDAIRFDELPRLADWATWASAAEPMLGVADGAVLEALKNQADEKTEIALEASIIAKPIRELVESRADHEWQGTASDLLKALDCRVDLPTTREKAWPKTPRGMAGGLARITHSLAAVGIGVERLARGSEVRGARILRLHLMGKR